MHGFVFVLIFCVKIIFRSLVDDIFKEADLDHSETLSFHEYMVRLVV